MIRRTRVLTALLPTIAAVVGYSLATRVDNDSNRTVDMSERGTQQAAARPALASRQAAERFVSQADIAAESLRDGTPTDITRWIEDTTSTDPTVRLAAIIALADAPKAQAMPTLRRVLEVGSSEPDRQVALRSLHTLAVEQGDEDGRIRDTFRSAIYHGDDEGVSQSAQAFLEDIEGVVAEGVDARTEAPHPPLR